MSIFQTERFWAGTEESLAAYIAENKHLAETKPAQPEASIYDPNAQQPAPRLFSKQGSVGVITIQGSLVNSSSWVNEYLGRAGYPEIRDALIHAASNPDIKAIALDIKSGGGAVSGVSDTADLISTIDAQVKPVYAYSDGMIASAAYWLGSSARSLDIGKVAEAGSIGVLVVHQENSKMLEEAGITTTVIRSGKFKAQGLSVEALSTLGKETLQAQVDHLNSMFVDHVASARGTSSAQVESKMGQGRVFIGQQAVDAGLADSVSNFDAFMSKVQQGIDIGNQKSKSGANLTKGPHVKNALTEQQIAAMAAGGASASGALPAGDTTEAATLAAAAAAAAEAEAEAKAKADADALAATEAAAEGAKPDAVVSMLQTQLAAAQSQIVALSVDLKVATDAAQASKDSAERMRPIARQAVGNLRVALGGVAAGVDALADDALLAEHANLASQFSTKFKVGGVAAISSSAATEKATGDAADSVRMARIRATRPDAKTK